MTSELARIADALERIATALEADRATYLKNNDCHVTEMVRKA